MEHISLDTKKFTIVLNLNRERELTNDIYKYFGKQLKWIVIYQLIKRKGFQFVLSEFEDFKKNCDCRDPWKLFLWKLGKVKVKLSPDFIIDSKQLVV